MRESMTRSNFLKLALGAAALPSTVVGRAPSPCTGRAAPSAPQNLSPKIARAKREVQLQLDYHLIGGCVFCSTAADMLKFVTDILHRKTFKKEVYDLLYTPTFDNATGRRSWGWDMGTKARPDGWSAASIFHSGFSGQTIAIDPEADFGGVVLTSRTAEHGTGIICRKRVLTILKEGHV